MPDESRLRAFLAPFWSETAHETPKDEDWPDSIRRIRQPGQTRVIREEAYRYFREVLPPHYHSGNFFAFAEGEEPLLLFTRHDETHLCRQLTWDETVSFCEVAGIDLPD